MNIEKYLDDLTKKYEKSNRNPNDSVIKDLKKSILSHSPIKINKISLFGSSIKQTNINDIPSVKLLISIKEKEKRSIEEIKGWFTKYFETIGKELDLKDGRFKFRFKDVNFVVVIAKKKEKTYNYHLITNLDASSKVQTNFDIHTKYVVENQVQKEIVLMKLWREKHQLNFPTMYLELVVLHVLRKYKKKKLFSRMIRILDYLRKDFVNDKFYDPSNTNNVISNGLSYEDKRKIQTTALLSLAEEYVSDIL